MSSAAGNESFLSLMSTLRAQDGLLPPVLSNIVLNNLAGEQEKGNLGIDRRAHDSVVFPNHTVLAMPDDMR